MRGAWDAARGKSMGAVGEPGIRNMVLLWLGPEVAEAHWHKQEIRATKGIREANATTPAAQVWHASYWTGLVQCGVLHWTGSILFLLFSGWR